MIPIAKYIDFWTRVNIKLPEIKRLLFVHNETELANLMGNVKASEPILIVIIPSADSSEIDKDDIRDMTAGMLFMVVKIDSKNRTPDVEKKVMTDMQNLIAAIKFLLHRETTDCEAEMHDYFEGTNFSSMHCDPERNLVGCDGWSLLFEIGDPFWTFTEDELIELFPNIND